MDGPEKVSKEYNRRLGSITGTVNVTKVTNLGNLFPALAATVLSKPLVQLWTAKLKPHVLPEPNMWDPLFWRGSSPHCVPDPRFWDIPASSKFCSVNEFTGHKR
jgi:hypothetical protein